MNWKISSDKDLDNVFVNNLHCLLSAGLHLDVVVVIVMLPWLLQCCHGYCNVVMVIVMLLWLP